MAFHSRAILQHAISSRGLRSSDSGETPPAARSTEGKSRLGKQSRCLSGRRACQERLNQHHPSRTQSRKTARRSFQLFREPVPERKRGLRKRQKRESTRCVGLERRQVQRPVTTLEIYRLWSGRSAPPEQEPLSENARDSPSPGNAELRA
jgi:hypothetical protein